MLLKVCVPIVVPTSSPAVLAQVDAVPRRYIPETLDPLTDVNGGSVTGFFDALINFLLFATTLKS